MIKVGLTGNYFSGYNEVGDIFSENRIPVFDADVIIKYLINYSEKHFNKIREVFGNDIYKMGLIDLDKFSNNSKFDELLDIIELDLIKYYENWRFSNKQKSFYTIFKSSILFERKFNEHMDVNISVFRPSNERRKDVTEYSFVTPNTIDHILSNEMCELEKNSKSDYVIHNYGSYYTNNSSFNVKKQISSIGKSINDKYKNMKMVNNNDIIKNITI